MAIGKVIKGGEPAPEPLAAEPPRSTVARPVRAGVVNAEEFEARTTARKIIDDAQAEAARIQAEAEANRAKYIEEAKKEGRDLGLKEVTEIIARAKLHRDSMLAEAEGEAVKLALKIAEKIIGRDVERDPEVLTDLIAQAAESARNAPQMTIRVHPQAAKILRQSMPKLMEKVGVTKVVNIKEDAEIEDVGCVLETPFGTIDAKLFTQIKVLEQVLLPDNAKKEVK